MAAKVKRENDLGSVLIPERDAASRSPSPGKYRRSGSQTRAPFSNRVTTKYF